MENIRTEQDLLLAIAALEAEQESARQTIREHVHDISEELHALGIIKNLLTRDGQPKSLVEKGIELTADFLNKRMEDKRSRSENQGIGRKLFSTVTKLVADYPLITAGLIGRISKGIRARKNTEAR